MNSEDFQNYSSSPKGGQGRWNTEIMIVAGLVAGLVAGRTRFGKLALLATAGGLVWRYLHHRTPVAPPPVPAPSQPAPASAVDAHVSELVASYWSESEHQPTASAFAAPEPTCDAAQPFSEASPFGLIEPSVVVPETKPSDDSKWAPMLAEALLLDRPADDWKETSLAPDAVFQANLTIAGMLAGQEPEVEIKAEPSAEVVSSQVIEAEEAKSEPESLLEASSEVEADEATPTGEFEAVSDPVWVEVEPEPGVREVDQPVATAEASSGFDVVGAIPTSEFEAVSEPVWVEVQPEPVVEESISPAVEVEAKPVLVGHPGPETQLMSSAAWLLGLEPMPMISAAGAVAVVQGRAESSVAVNGASSMALNVGAEFPDRIEIPEHIAQVPADVPPVPQIDHPAMRPITKGFLNKVLENVDVRPKTVPLVQAVELPKPKLAIPLAAGDVPMTSPLATASHEPMSEGAIKPIPRPASWLAAELAMNATPTPSPESVSDPKVPSRRIQPLAPATAGEKKAWLEWWK